MRQRFLPALVVLVLLVGSGCQVDLGVTTTVQEDGSGEVAVEVRLDEEASARIPDLGQELATEDLEAAGWTVEPPQELDGGGAVITATKRFGTPAEAASVLGEVFGPEGPLREIELSRERSFGTTAYSFAAVADWSGGLEALADAELAEVLGGDPFGGNLTQIEEETGKPVAEQVSLEVAVQLPGGSETWDLEPGSASRTLEVESREVRPVPWLLVVGAGVAFLAGLLLLVTRVLGGRARRGDVVLDAMEAPAEETPVEEDAAAGEWVSGEGEVVTAQSAAVHDEVPEEETVVAAQPPDQPRERRLRLVVLDVMGVVFAGGRDTEGLLTEFVADKGSTASAGEVSARYRQAAEGRLAVGELWEVLGVEGDPGDLSDEFLAIHRLVPGVREFLERMRARELPVACVSDDVAEWSRKLRSTHKLDGLTALWLVSGDVGERLPGGALCSRVIQMTGVEARDSFFISDSIENLEVARSFGFAVACFRPDGQGDEDFGYPVIESFGDLGAG